VTGDESPGRHSAAAGRDAYVAGRDIRVCQFTVPEMPEAGLEAPSALPVARTPPAPMLVPELNGASAIELGVHRSVPLPGHIPDSAHLSAELPEYVPREYDEQLRSALDAASSRNLMLVLVGDSCTGKTRSAFEAVRERLPGWRLLHPITPEQVIALPGSALPANTVIWLGEARAYLEGSQGEHVAQALRHLLKQGGPLAVIGTLHHFHWGDFTRVPVPEQNDLRRHTRALLNTARCIGVPNAFTKGEFHAAYQPSRRDPRLADAIEALLPDTGRGEPAGNLAAVLACGPELVRRWEQAPPPAKAVLTAAADAWRVGHPLTLPAGLLRDASIGYVPGAQLAAFGDTWFPDALAYVSDPVHGVIAALTPTGSAPGRVDGYVLADYLAHEISVAREEEPPAGALWDALTAYTSDSEVLHVIACRAEGLGEPGRAADLWRGALRNGRPQAAAALAELLPRLGRLGELADVWREALAAGFPESAWWLSAALIRRRRGADAAAMLREALLAGWVGAGWQLTSLLTDQEARIVLEEAVAAGIYGAAGFLGPLLRRAGQVQEAERVFRTGAAAGDHASALGLVDLLICGNRVEDAVRASRDVIAERRYRIGWALVDRFTQLPRTEYAAVEVLRILIESLIAESIERPEWRITELLSPDKANQVLRAMLTEGDLEPLVNLWERLGWSRSEIIPKINETEPGDRWQSIWATARIAT
jgi:hypothetical protein